MIVMKIKPCSICKVRDRIANQGYCKGCASDYAEKWRKLNKDKLAKYKRINRERNLIRSFGLTIEEYEVKLKAQNECCALCGMHESENDGRRLAVDHCHKTGKIRDLLCTSCNLGIGNLRECPKLMTEAIAYVQRHA